jgi:signal transduction histidine kinase
VRRRLLTVGLVGIVALLLTLIIPLAAVYGRQQQSTHAIRELAAAQITARELTVAVEGRMPSTIAQALALRAAPDRALVVLLRDGTVLGEMGISWADLSGAGQRIAQQALRGRAGQSPIDDVLPADDLVTAVPVSQGEETVGAVVSVSAIDATRGRIIDRWLLLAALAVLVIAAYIAVALPITHWLIRPIDDLTTAALRNGSRSRPRVATTTGPPELRRLALAFNEMSDSVERALERQRSFAADASHQLRNPLTSLRLRVENLEPHVDDIGAAPLADALGEVERMEQLVVQLLALAGAGEREDQRVPVDVAAVAAERVEHWRRQSGRRIDLTVGDLSLGASASLCEGSLDHALDILLDNAVTYTSRDDSIDVRIGDAPSSSNHSSGRLHVSVADRGRGMTASECERACDRFWRGPAAAGTLGSGLGLSIARRLIVQSGGELVLRPAPSAGLEAVITLQRWVPAGVHSQVLHGAGVI